MWSLILSKIGVKGVVVAIAVPVILGIVSLGYRHYTGLVEDKANLTADVASLTEEVGQLSVDKTELEGALHRNEIIRQEQEADIQELALSASSAQREARRLNDIFAEHDLTRLSLAKPGLIERRINGGTARVGRMLECASAGTCPNTE